MNAAARGGGFRGHGGRGVGRMPGGCGNLSGHGTPFSSRGRGRQGRGTYASSQRYEDSIICHVCGKRNHTATDCCHRFDESYVLECQVNPNWYADTGATDHITGELKKLAVWNKYQGADHIHMASGTGMDINHIGHTTVDTPNHPILLTNTIYVPKTRKNLVSIHRLTLDNSIYVEFHPFFFLSRIRKPGPLCLKEDV
jgi:hypothetical protein